MYADCHAASVACNVVTVLSEKLHPAKCPESIKFQMYSIGSHPEYLDTRVTLLTFEHQSTELSVSIDLRNEGFAGSLKQSYNLIIGFNNMVEEQIQNN